MAMATKRTERLNSLLKEVISEVIRKDVRNPHVNELVNCHAGANHQRFALCQSLYQCHWRRPEKKRETLAALQSACGIYCCQFFQESSDALFS